MCLRLTMTLAIVVTVPSNPTLGALETVHSVLSLLQRSNGLPGANDNSVAGRAVRGVAILLRHYCLPRLLNERFGPDGSDERVVLCQRTLPRKRVMECLIGRL